MAFWRNSQYDLQSRRATIAQDLGQWDTPLPSLIGKDQFFRGPGQAPNFDWPNPSFALPRNAAYRAAQLAQDSSQVHQFLHELDGKDAVNSGKVSVDLPPRAPARIQTTFEPGVQSLALANVVVGLPSGASVQDLPPHTPARAREYGQTTAFPLVLIGQDAVNAGKQSTELPPRGPLRARDYTFTASFPLELRGQDQFNPGTQSFELPPRAPLRAREYGQASSFPLALIGQDQFNAGEQSTDLPVPVAPRRQAALEPGVQSLALPAAVVAVVALPTGEQFTDLPPRAAARATDYTWLQSFPLELLGQDQVNPGEQSTELPPRGFARSVDYTWLQQFALDVYEQIPVGVQVFDLAPKGPARAADYTFIARFPLELIGQDATNAGEQSFELPPRAPVRARDYSYSASFPLVLIGQDAVNVGEQSVDLPPRGFARAKDYSFTASFPLELIGKDQRNAGQSTDLTALPPKAPARSRDYTFVHPFPLELNGKDTFFRGSGIGPNYDWPNPSFKIPRGAASLAASLSQDPTQVHQYTLGLIGKDAVNPGKSSYDLPTPSRPWHQSPLEPGTDALALTVQPVLLPTGTQAFDLPVFAAPRRQPAFEVGSVSIALEEAVPPTPVPPTVPEEPKPGGKGQRRRLTRFRRQLEPRFINGALSAPTARLQATLRPSWAVRMVSAWLTPAASALRLSAHVLNPRHVRAQLAAPAPNLLGCRGASTAALTGCTTLQVRANAPTLRANLKHTPDETWLLALLLAEGRDALRSWQDEATKRLSNLQRQANAHAARTDAQQDRLVQASLPHLRHALMAQRDAALVALPHATKATKATKASIDPQFILDDAGFQAAVVLLMQAIEDLQEAGVTLGYTDTSPTDVFDLQNPYVAAAVKTLGDRISGITETTADSIRAVIATGLDEGWTVAEMGGAIQQLSAFSDARALMIASTESRVALNFGNAASWQEMGVTEVLISDGDYDEVCAELDGTTQSLDWYLANPIGHPNCRRSGTAIPTA